MNKILVMLAFCLIVCAGVSEAKNAPAQEVRYDKELLTYQILFSPPAGWNKVILEVNIPAVYYIREDKKANIAVRVPQAATPAYFNAMSNMVRATRKPIAEEEITLLDVPCYVFTFVVKAKSGKIIKTQEYLFFKNGKLYGLDYTSDAQEFDRYLGEFKKALGSFALK